MSRSPSFALEVLLAAAVVVPAAMTTARSDGRLLLRLKQGGGDLVLFHTTYELRESRVLSRTRTSPLQDVLRVRLTADEYRRCLDLLLEAGYSSTGRSEPPKERSRRPWRRYRFATTWGLSLFRAGQRVDGETIPERSLTRDVPELTEDRRVRAGWALLTLFEEKLRQVGQ